MTRFISETKYFIIRIISSIIYLFCGCKKIIIFESSSDFCDNSRALFDYMISKNLNKKYKMIWFVRNEKSIEKYSGKYENVFFKKLSYSPNPFSKTFWVMMYYFSVANYAFYTHDFIGGEGNKKQKRMYLTHGAMSIKQSKGFFGSQKHNTEISIISEFAGYYSEQIFQDGINKYRILGNPRNDKLFLKDKNISKLFPSKNYAKKILWMPTFKHINNCSRNDFKSNTKEDISILTTKNVDIINKKLKETNTLLIIKFHPAQDMRFVPELDKSNIITITNDDLSKYDINLYSFIGECDAYITDFSSVYYDFLLCDKPIAFELNDKEKYENGIGFLFDKPLEYMHGDKIYDIDDFIKYIDDISKGNDKYKKERRKFTDICHKYKDGNSSKRIYEYYGFDKE